MNKNTLKKILEEVATGSRDIDDAFALLKTLFTEDIGFAHIDHHRILRKGFPEVIYGEGKSAAQISRIMERMGLRSPVILATRIAPGKAGKILPDFPGAEYDHEARMIIWEKKPFPITGKGDILVIAAGTSDIPVAKEASLTAKVMGNRVTSIWDVGVAGIHRLMEHRKLITAASVLIVVAGMEGALPSVVAGMVDKPVIGVPTSIGYGANLGGLTPLFAMLNSCSSNVAVVNIDNGFGAGYMAALINRL